jgi:two-component system, chemotaxis family, CheB/CheR fusion protein
VLAMVQGNPPDRHQPGRAQQPVWKSASPKRVLIVEDDLDAVHAFEALLVDMGHTVEYAINGYVALDIAKKFRPDVVFLDLGLPGLSGFDVCSRLKSEPGFQRTRIIAITAYGQDDMRVRSRAAGCEMHLVKPVPPNVIEQILG